MVSFTKKAEKTPETSDDAGQQQQRAVRVLHHPGAHQREEAGKPQVRDHDHHAEQQNDGVVVDRGVGLVDGQHVGGDHQAGSDNGRAGAVDAEARKAADPKDQVRRGEDQNGNEQELLSHSAGRVSFWCSI